jgi:hypothetical protein
VNNQTTSLVVLPYPIPPAGVDPSTWQPDEEPPPFTISMRMSSQLLVPAALHVGWWDQQHNCWSEEGIRLAWSKSCCCMLYQGEVGCNKKLFKLQSTQGIITDHALAACF